MEILAEFGCYKVVDYTSLDKNLKPKDRILGIEYTNDKNQVYDVWLWWKKGKNIQGRNLSVSITLPNTMEAIINFMKASIFIQDFLDNKEKK